MKYSFIYTGLLSMIFLLSSCQGVVSNSLVMFTKPQPSETQDMPKFPLSLQGVYISADESQIVKINDKGLFINNTLIATYHKDSVDNYFYKKDDYYYIKEDNLVADDSLKFTGERLNDSIKLKTLMNVDTLFLLNENNKLRRNNEQYFLNVMKSNDVWDVKKIEKINNILIVSTIADSSKISYLRNMTKSSDTATIFNLSRKQFTDFLHSDGFSKRDTVYRITD